MDTKKLWIIYLITNLVNRKSYIGKTSKTLMQRWSVHKSHSLYDYKNLTKSFLQNAIRKYGVENFCIKELNVAYSPQASKFLETFYINYYNSCNPKYGYNLTFDSSDGGIWRTDESRKNLSDSLRLKACSNNANNIVGVTYSPEIMGKKREKAWICRFEYLNDSKVKRFKTEKEAAMCYDKLFIHIMDEGISPPNYPEKIKEYKSLDLKAHYDDFFKKKNMGSKYQNVTKDKLGRFMARIKVNNERLYLGLYTTDVEAAIVYDKVKFYYDIKFGKYNFPELVKTFDKEEIAILIRKIYDPIATITKDKTSVYRGVSPQRQTKTPLFCWEFSHKGKRYRGTDRNEIVAAEKRDQIAYQLQGAAAILNFPEKIPLYSQNLHLI